MDGHLEMNDAIFVAAAEIPSSRRISAVRGPSYRVALINLGEALVALRDDCPHEGCSFTDSGMVVDSTIVCGCHGSRFELPSGRLIDGPAYDNLETFEITQIEEGYVLTSSRADRTSA